MPCNPQNNELVRALLSAVNNLTSNGDTTAARAVASAINAGLQDAGLLGTGYCAPVSHCATPSAPEFNKMRTMHKDYDTAGFSDQSLTVTVKSEPCGDVLIINGANEFRSIHKRVPIKRGLRVDRDTLSAQLRLGVLKVTGRTYKSCTPEWMINKASKTVRPIMRPNRG